MNRNERIRIAERTLQQLAQGNYQAPSGRTVGLLHGMKLALARTSLHESPRTPTTRTKKQTRIDVTKESTVAAILRLAPETPGHLAALNFASAKNPGGGFLGGAQAQEESLARTSGLYPCLLTQMEFYRRHRENRCLLYQDLAIFSPSVPFFVNDDGQLLESPALTSVITCPAPNAGAVTNNQPENLSLVQETLNRRANFVLQLAANQQVDSLILGAWGCGVFRNDPTQVAAAFGSLLLGEGPFRSSFTRITFAIYDTSAGGAVYRAFAHHFQPTG